MRGCGAGIETASQLTHAGRSDDIIAALEAIARLTANGASGKIGAIGISLSANQLLRAVSRVGAGLDARPNWFDRLWRIAAVAPPLDLTVCSENMNRISRRPYNRYFIHWLLKRIPAKVRLRADFQRSDGWGETENAMAARRSLYGTAERIPGCRRITTGNVRRLRVTKHNRVDTLVVAAKDDPLVPIHCFLGDRKSGPRQLDWS